MTNYFPNHQQITIHKKRCYENHPDLKIISVSGKSYTITGGSCVVPFDGYDIYVGFDPNMDISKKHYPWNKGHEIIFPIRDRQAPSDPKQFAKLIDWLEIQLEKGQQIHLGCIGGHGRTGTVLAALYTQMSLQSNAIQYVRENYCSQAVESKEQVRFLMKHYKVDHAKVRKFVHTDIVKGKNGYQPNYGSKYFGTSFNF